MPTSLLQLISVNAVKATRRGPQHAGTHSTTAVQSNGKCGF